jgi:hypothetical protein
MREDIKLYNTALDCAQIGDWKATIATVCQAIALEPDEAEYHSLLAVAYLGCRARRIPVAQINPSMHKSMCAGQSDFATYTKLARRAFYNAFLIDPGDPLLDSYMSWLFGAAPGNDGPPPSDHHPNPDRAPKPSPPDWPTHDTAANFIDAEAITQIP